MYPLVILTALLAIIVRWVEKFVSRRRLAKKLGCSSPVKIPSSEALKTIAKANREGKGRWRFITPLFEKYGDTWMFRPPPYTRRVLFTVAPENLRAMMSSQFGDYGTGKRVHQLRPLFGEGIFTASGQVWAHARTELKPQFSKDNISQLQMLEGHVPELVEAIRQSNGKPINAQELCYRYTIDSAMDFLVGERMGAMEAYLKNPENEFVQSSEQQIDWKADYPVESPEGKKRFCQAFEIAQKHTHLRAANYDTYWLLPQGDLPMAVAELQRHGEYYVEKALRASDQEKMARPNTFLYQAALTNRNKKFLRDQFLSLLLAARDTTTAWLTWTFYYLSHHPKEVAKLRNAIIEHFGPGTADDVEAITLDKLRDCDYLKAVIQETLRLSPSVPMNYRVANHDTTLPKGGGPKGDQPIFVAKGELIYFGPYYLHRRKEAYGEDALVWNPERWEKRKPRAWEYLPFSGGPRVCMGQQYATTEASYFLVRLLQNFSNITPAPGTKEYNYEDGHRDLTFKRLNGLFQEGKVPVCIT